MSEKFDWLRESRQIAVEMFNTGTPELVEYHNLVGLTVEVGIDLGFHLQLKKPFGEVFLRKITGVSLQGRGAEYSIRCTLSAPIVASVRRDGMPHEVSKEWEPAIKLGCSTIEITTIDYYRLWNGWCAHYMTDLNSEHHRMEKAVSIRFIL